MSRWQPSATLSLFLALSSTLACSQAEAQGDGGTFDIEVADAEPQDGPPPAGDADAGTAPQIISVSGPETVSPGQVVTLYLLTDFDPGASITDVAIQIEGVDGWFKAPPKLLPAGEGDGGRWKVEVSAVVAASANPDETTSLQLALVSDQLVGAFVSWSPRVGDGDPLDCPAAAQCSAVGCGPDPVCGIDCGGCGLGEICGAVSKVCEPLDDTGTQRIAFASSPSAISPSEGRAHFDAVCQADADAVGFSGTYLAFIHTAEEAPVDRFDVNSSGWYRPDGVQVIPPGAAGLPILADTVHLDATGAALPDTDPERNLAVGTWSPWSPGGSTSPYTCNDWVDPTPDENYVYHDAYELEMQTYNGTPCDGEIRVLCLQE